MHEPPSVPERTGPNGRALWEHVTGVWDLEEHELAMLREAVRTVDTLDALHALVERDGLMLGPRMHPAAVEARQLKISLARLLAALRLPDGDEGDASKGRRQRRVGARGVYLRAAG